MSNRYEQYVVAVTKRALGVLTLRSKALGGPLRDNIEVYVIEGVRAVLTAMTEPSEPDQEELLRAVCDVAWRKMRDDAGGGTTH